MKKKDQTLSTPQEDELDYLKKKDLPPLQIIKANKSTAGSFR